MSTELIENSATLYHLALTLIHFIWQGGLIAFALKLTLLFTSFKQVQFRYFASCTAMLACLLAPIATFTYIYQPEINSSALFLSNNLFVDLENAALHSTQSAWYDEFVITLPYVSIIWLTVVLLLSSKLLTELYQIKRLSQVGTVQPSDQLQQRFEQLIEKVGASKNTRLFITLKTSVPMALGWLKPVVLIPASMVTGLTPQQLDMLLLHELAHVRRHDYLVNFIQTLVETLLFFHPAVRWISKQIRNEREYCSDDIAVEHAGCAVAYAHTLADTASLCRQHRHNAIPSMAMAASGGDLKQRVVRLVDQHHCSTTDDSGKFLASSLIIISMLALAAKPYINLPFIDLSSGYIFFSDQSKDQVLAPNFDKVSVSDSSLASLLLNQENPLQQEQHKPEKIEVSVLNRPEKNPFELQTTARAQQTISEKKATLLKSSNVVEKQLEVKVTSRKSNSVNKLAATNNTVVANNKAPHIVLDKPMLERSSSDIAFEKTDSANSNSGLKNPYANDIAALIEEPQARIVDEYNTDWGQPAKTAEPIAIKSKANNQDHALINAKAIVSPDPRYPSTAKRRGLELDIKVHFTIDENGRVKNLEFEKKSKVNYFRSAIRDAMSKWRFLPAKLNGQPVESHMSKIFSFNLMQ